MKKRPKILVVGSFMMDLIATTKYAPCAGETVLGQGFQTAPGGKGANQAVQCARLGAQVTMVGKVGNDFFGKTMLDTAKSAGVDVSHVLVDERESSGVGHIVLEVGDSATQNRITVCPGANFTLTVEEVAWLKDSIQHYDMVLMQFELQMPVIEQVAQWAKESGVPVMLNPAPAAPISDKLLSCITYLSPNEHEASALANHPLSVQEEIPWEDITQIAQWFQSCGVTHLLLTMGSRGAVSVAQGHIHHTPCVQIEQVADPTAAGDSFIAAFCTGLTFGLSEPQAMEFASYTAALTVSRMGAMPSLPTGAEVQAFMRQRGYTGFDLAWLDQESEPVILNKVGNLSC